MTDAPKAPSEFFGPAWEGWESYRQFAESVNAQLRYVRSELAERFLTNVRGSCDSRKVTIPKAKMFWRARLGCKEELVTDEHDDIAVSHIEEQPYDRKDMKPISNWQTEGRANPRGIPYLYLATDMNTALAEVRPWIGATISVAQLKIQREISVIDCSKHHAKDNLFDIVLDRNRSKEDGIWVAIDQAFATPVNKDDEAREYIPTQVIAEFFKSEGFDGIVYKSLLSNDGFNLALFNLNDAEVVYCALYQAASLRYEFQKGNSEYFTSG